MATYSLEYLWNVEIEEAQEMIDTIVDMGYDVPNEDDVHVRLLYAIKAWVQDEEEEILDGSYKIIMDDTFMENLKKSKRPHSEKLVFALYETVPPVNIEEDEEKVEDEEENDGIYITPKGWKLISEVKLDNEVLNAIDRELSPTDNSQNIQINPISESDSKKIDRLFNVGKGMGQIYNFLKSEQGEDYLNLATGRYVKHKSLTPGYFILKQVPSQLTIKSLDRGTLNGTYINGSVNSKIRVNTSSGVYQLNRIPGYKLYFDSSKFDGKFPDIITNIYDRFIRKGLVNDMNNHSNQCSKDIEVIKISDEQLQDERYAAMER